MLFSKFTENNIIQLQYNINWSIQFVIISSTEDLNIRFVWIILNSIWPLPWWNLWNSWPISMSDSLNKGCRGESSAWNPDFAAMLVSSFVTVYFNFNLMCSNATKGDKRDCEQWFWIICIKRICYNSLASYLNPFNSVYSCCFPAISHSESC